MSYEAKDHIHQPPWWTILLVLYAALLISTNTCVNGGQARDIRALETQVAHVSSTIER